MDRLRLLIIEDDQDQRELIREAVEYHFGPGTVVEAATCKVALQHDLDSFDLILSDYNLPDANGLDVLDRIRERSTTPIIMVTGENVGRIAAEAIRKGATDYIVKLGDYLFTIPLVIQKNLTVAKLLKEKEELRRQLEARKAELEAMNAQLEHMAATDPLTGLYNRRHFGRVLEQLFAETQRYSQGLSCAMIDLDDYKRLNDTMGHQVGDELLVMAAQAISANLRKMDIAARYGGDEFVLLLPHATAQEAAGVAGRIRDEFALGSAEVLGRGRGLTMSIGVASTGQTAVFGGDQLVAQADAALFRAKGSGRNRTVIAGEQAEEALRSGLTPGPRATRVA